MMIIAGIPAPNTQTSEYPTPVAVAVPILHTHVIASSLLVGSTIVGCTTATTTVYCMVTGIGLAGITDDM